MRPAVAGIQDHRAADIGSVGLKLDTDAGRAQPVLVVAVVPDLAHRLVDQALGVAEVDVFRRVPGGRGRLVISGGRIGLAPTGLEVLINANGGRGLCRQREVQLVEAVAVGHIRGVRDSVAVVIDPDRPAGQRGFARVPDAVCVFIVPLVAADAGFQGDRGRGHLVILRTGCELRGGLDHLVIRRPGNTAGAHAGTPADVGRREIQADGDVTGVQDHDVGRGAAVPKQRPVDLAVAGG